MATLQMSERRHGGVTVLTLAGRLVLDEGDVPLRDRIDSLIAEGRLDIVLNVHDVTYVDSCGIGALVEKFVGLRRRGGHLKLVCPTDRCRHVLEVTHLLPIFDIYDSDERAVRSFSASDDARRTQVS